MEEKECPFCGLTFKNVFSHMAPARRDKLERSVEENGNHIVGTGNGCRECRICGKRFCMIDGYNHVVVHVCEEELRRSGVLRYVTCPNCGNTSFRVEIEEGGGKVKLACTKCGREVDLSYAFPLLKADKGI